MTELAVAWLVSLVVAYVLGGRFERQSRSKRPDYARQASESSWEKTVRMFAQHAGVMLITVSWRRQEPDSDNAWLRAYEQRLGLEKRKESELS